MNYKFGVLVFVAHVCSALALPPCVCTRNFRPVCGSDGKTYSNACVLNCERSKGNSELTVVKQGNCGDDPLVQPVCICPDNYAPVCGNDRITYPNYCEMNCAKSSVPSLEVKHNGECKNVNDPEAPMCACTRDMKPICGSDGNTYNNICLFNCAAAANTDMTIKHEGPCADKVIVAYPIPTPSCSCTRNLQPVCGSDGNTYSNPCLLNCATASNPSLSIQHEGSCDNSVKVVDHPLPDDKPACSCTRNLELVCGSDGKTYNNECLLRCAGDHVSLVKHEPCELVNFAY